MPSPLSVPCPAAAGMWMNGLGMWMNGPNLFPDTPPEDFSASTLKKANFAAVRAAGGRRALALTPLPQPPNGPGCLPSPSRRVRRPTRARNRQATTHAKSVLPLPQPADERRRVSKGGRRAVLGRGAQADAHQARHQVGGAARGARPPAQACRRLPATCHKPCRSPAARPLASLSWQQRCWPGAL